MTPKDSTSPWPALWALVIGFFMILVDITIVSVATPALKTELNASYSAVIWVTSAYLLAYAVPLLVTGRLGDRFGPKRVYLLGLSVFTLSSLWCGLTGTIEWLIVARVFQGFGASMMSPQTMTVITRTFPPMSRGKAMSLWGATAGVATMVGPILGGVLVEHAGWQWIFLVNVPVGIIGLVLAYKWVPRLPTHSHTFDWTGVVLSVIAVSLLIFGIQEGHAFGWGTISGWLSIPLMLGVGLIFFVLFVVWQAKNTREPLVPLSLFRDRNFSVSSTAIIMVSFSITALPFPFMLWTQTAKGWTPTEAGLILVPMAVLSVVLAPVVGTMVDKHNPRNMTRFGFGTASLSAVLLIVAIRLDAGALPLLGIMALLGLASAFIWSPLSTAATFNLPMAQAGAGSGVYNATRQMGAVLGSAAIAAAISARIAIRLPDGDGGAIEGDGSALPPAMTEGFSNAMADALFVPLAAYVIGFILVSFYQDKHGRVAAQQ